MRNADCGIEPDAMIPQTVFSIRYSVFYFVSLLSQEWLDHLPA
jgi:hypothetical protein